MRRLQLRVTVWRSMIAIALIAVVMGLAVSPRWRTCSREADYHASEERSFLQAANSFDGRAATLPGNGPEATVSKVMAAAFFVFRTVPRSGLPESCGSAPVPRRASPRRAGPCSTGQLAPCSAILPGRISQRRPRAGRRGLSGFRFR